MKDLDVKCEKCKCSLVIINQSMNTEKKIKIGGYCYKCKKNIVVTLK